MTKPEVVAMFASLEELLREGNTDAALRVIKRVLESAEDRKPSEDKKQS